MNAHARLYRRLVRLFPRELREAYGEEMARLYAERRREVAGRRWAGAWLALEAALDLLVQAALEWGRVAYRAARPAAAGAVAEAWLRDLRFGARSLLRRPGFTTAAVTTLALGIGATVALFSVVDAVLIEPLPYPGADRIVAIWQVNARTGVRSRGVDHPDVRRWQREVSGFRVAGYAGSRLTLTGLGEPEVVPAARVTDGLLGVFGLHPALGRDLRADDDVEGGPNVVVLSHSFWKDRLAGDAGAVGRTIALNGESWEIVGVTPQGFDFPVGAALWIPRRHVLAECGHGCRIMNAVGRIEPGATLDAVQARLEAVSVELAGAVPDSHRDLGTALEPLLRAQVVSVRTALRVLMGSAAMVLLIACANVAGLLLVRADARRGDVALRAALGAGRARIVRQLLTECLLLSTVAGAAGVALAAWGVPAMVSLAPDGIPRLDEVGVDGRVLGFAVLLVLGVTVSFGLAPALGLARGPLVPAPSSRGRAEDARARRRSRSVLLAAEVALTLMLLLGAGLLFGTLRAVRSQDLGFATERVERFRVSLPDSRYDAAEVVRFFDELEARLATLPEVDVAGSAFGVPLGSGRIHTSVALLDREPVDPADLPSFSVRPASSGYREAMGLPLLRGRWFTEADRMDAEGVVVINQAAAERFYPGVDPLGRRVRMDITWGFDAPPARTIIGVVADARSYRATEPDDPTAYLPNAQFAADVLYVTMRLAPGAHSALPAARAVLDEMDPALAVTNTERIEDAVAAELAPTRFYLTLIGAFASLALVLACVGLYGVVAYSVSRRTREIGLRMALGARGGEVVAAALKDGLVPAAAGVVVGLAASLLVGRALGSLLYGVEPHDPATLAAVTALVLAVSLAATLVPARRASRVPPASALRVE